MVTCSHRCACQFASQLTYQQVSCTADERLTDDGLPVVDRSNLSRRRRKHRLITHEMRQILAQCPCQRAAAMTVACLQRERTQLIGMHAYTAQRNHARHCTIARSDNHIACRWSRRLHKQRLRSKLLG